jgi:hypothetical protein
MRGALLRAHFASPLGINRAVWLRRDPPAAMALRTAAWTRHGGVRRRESRVPSSPSIICSSFLRIELGFHLEQRVHTSRQPPMKGHDMSKLDNS